MWDEETPSRQPEESFQTLVLRFWLLIPTRSRPSKSPAYTAELIPRNSLVFEEGAAVQVLYSLTAHSPHMQVRKPGAGFTQGSKGTSPEAPLLGGQRRWPLHRGRAGADSPPRRGRGSAPVPAPGAEA